MTVPSVVLFVCLCLQIVFGQFDYFSNQREQRRYGDQPGFFQNFLPRRHRIRHRLQNIQSQISTGIEYNPYDNRYRNTNGYDQYGQMYPGNYPSYGDYRPIEYPNPQNGYYYPTQSNPSYENVYYYGPYSENTPDNQQPSIPEPIPPINIPNQVTGNQNDDAVKFPYAPSTVDNNIHNERKPDEPVSPSKPEIPILMPVPTGETEDVTFKPISEVNSNGYFNTIPSVPQELPTLTPVPLPESEIRVPTFKPYSGSNSSGIPFTSNNQNEQLPTLTPAPPSETVSQQLPFKPLPAEFGGSSSDAFSSGSNYFPSSTKPSLTTLMILTPVPTTASRNSFNFENQGPFQETCDTIDGGLGSCVSVFNCQKYLDLLQQSKTNPEVIVTLRKAHCGFDGNNPKVCCPKQGIPTVPPTVPTETTIAPTPAPTPVPTSPSGKTVEGDYLTAFPEPPVCGSTNATFPRVVGGVPAKLGDFPWMAVLGYKRGQSYGWQCGGSLITSRHVLTAAHCIHGREAILQLVRVGDLDLEKDDDGASPQDIFIKTKVKHEKYGPTSYTNDIGLLTLERDVQFTDLIRPICLPRESNLRSTTFEKYTPLVAGWGQVLFNGPASSHLLVTQLPVVSNDYCAQAYSAYKAQVIDQRVLCAGYKAGGKDSCKGDSGGPLMQPISNSQTFKTYFYQIGVVSFGKNCAEAGYPGVYSRVTEFIPWIEEKVLGTAQ